MTEPQRYTADDRLTHDGIEQPIYEWALDYGITPALIMSRLKKGLSVEQAITKPMSTRTTDTLEWMDSRHYQRKLAAADRKQDDTQNDVHRYAVDRFEHDGTTMTLSEWSKHIGIKLQTLQWRLGRGWSISEALLTPLRPSGRRPGVVLNSRVLKGTGGGSTAQETTKITFQKSSNSR